MPNVLPCPKQTIRVVPAGLSSVNSGLRNPSEFETVRVAGIVDLDVRSQFPEPLGIKVEHQVRFLSPEKQHEFADLLETSVGSGRIGKAGDGFNRPEKEAAGDCGMDQSATDAERTSGRVGRSSFEIDCHGGHPCLEALARMFLRTRGLRQPRIGLQACAAMDCWTVRTTIPVVGRRCEWAGRTGEIDWQLAIVCGLFESEFGRQP